MAGGGGARKADGCARPAPGQRGAAPFIARNDDDKMTSQ
jgi:hypothetical protein